MVQAGQMEVLRTGGGTSQLPTATCEYLQNLAPAHRRLFPVSDDSEVESGVHEDDTPEGVRQLSLKVAMLRTVLGGWLEGLKGEEDKAGVHSKASSETVAALHAAIPGSLRFLTERPMALLHRTKPPKGAMHANTISINTSLSSTAQAALSLSVLGEGDHDLATFLWPQILRATSSLEAAILLSGPLDTTEELSETKTPRQDRVQLRERLEDMLQKIIVALAESAVRAEWRGRETVVQGGVGKARSMISEMLSLLRGTLTYLNEPHSSYPLAFKETSFDLRSSIHARAFFISTIRVLFKVVAISPFLNDYTHEIMRLLSQGWPLVGIRQSHSLKGKEKLFFVRDQCSIEILEIIASFSERQYLSAFDSLDMNLITFELTRELKERLKMATNDLYATTEPKSSPRANDFMLTIMYCIWSALSDLDQESTAESRNLTILTDFVRQDGKFMLNYIFEVATQPYGDSIYATSLLLLAIICIGCRHSNILPIESMFVKTELEMLSNLIAHPEKVGSRKASIIMLQRKACDAWHTTRLKINIWLQRADASTMRDGPQRKRRKTGEVNESNEKEHGTIGQSKNGLVPSAGDRSSERRWLHSRLRHVVKRTFNLVPFSLDDVQTLEGLIVLMLKAALNEPELDRVKISEAVGVLSCSSAIHDEDVLEDVGERPLPTSLARPSCPLCDAWLQNVTLPSQINDIIHNEIKVTRTLNDSPIRIMRSFLKSTLDLDTTVQVTIASLRAMRRLVGHCKAIGWNIARDSVVLMIVSELSSSERPLREAAGHALLAIVQTHQETSPSSNYIDDLFKHVDLCLVATPAVIETTLYFVGRVARIATFQGPLECQCLIRLITRLAYSNMFLKSLARTQLEEIAEHHQIKPYALIQPHLRIISPILVNSTPATLSATLDCLSQPRDSFLSVTQEYTLPSIVLNGQMTLLEQVAEASNKPIAHMLLDKADTILAHIFMQPSDRYKPGLTVFMREIGKGEAQMKHAVDGEQTEPITLSRIIGASKIPLIYKIALDLGSETPAIAALAADAIRNVERHFTGASAKANVELGAVLKESIVGILSHMNRGLNEPPAHRPILEKQKIIKSLGAVTALVGPAIAGFSPQIMATLQSALEMDGLRDVTLQAFKIFMETLKFSEIGPFIGTTSATFVRLWSEFTPAERAIAIETIEYIVLGNADHLSDFVQDIADLSDVPELERANKRLREIRKSWSFGQRSGYLMTRIGSENDVVALQALKELRALMMSTLPQLQALSAGDSFDRSVGTLVKVLFSAASRDGTENEHLRNTAFQCLGLLGALDPDRFDSPPADAPVIVLDDFDNVEESINFALHLIEHLLIGAYRTTNDTKHQEHLAFAIQELLRFCGFTSELISPTASANRNLDPSIKSRWNKLPKPVLEACGPLLGGAFYLPTRSILPAKYPIYANTTSYRDWICVWAKELIRKLEGQTVTSIFSAFPGVLNLEDTSIAQHLLPHLVLHALISGDEDGREHIKMEMETVLTDQVSPTHHLSDNNRLLSAQTVFTLMDHISRYITEILKKQQDLRAKKKTTKNRTDSDRVDLDAALLHVEGTLQDIPVILVGQAALTCKAYARSLLNFESHVVALRSQKKDSSLQDYYDHLHECYAALDEPDGMEGISTRIITPSVQHQIREHESTGRWTSAQSCWEVKLQQKPDEPRNHVGLLRCLRNLGHYDSMRTHIIGILYSKNSEQADWDRILAPFNIEASLIVGDWRGVEEALGIPNIEGPEVTFGKVVSAMKQGSEEELANVFFEAREQLGGPITAAGRESYRRVYDSVVHLHILQELQDIHSTLISKTHHLPNKLVQGLNARLSSTSPSFRAREPILNMRRTAFRLLSTDATTAQIGELWLETSKIARKAGHIQTAYSAILQARDLSASFAFLQSAKLLKAQEQDNKAIQEIDSALQALIPASFTEQPELASTLTVLGPPTPLAKASLRRARWMHEAGRLDSREIIEKYTESARLAPDWESPDYYLGHHWDQLYEATDKKKGPKGGDDGLAQRLQMCKLYSQALSHGTKFIYQAMPRMLTVWLELGEQVELLKTIKAKKKNPQAPLDGLAYETYRAFVAINKVIQKNITKLPPYQWLTVLPQLVSRILHPNELLFEVLERILLKVLASYPHQGFWAMASGAKSTTARRSRRCLRVFQRAKENYAQAPGSIDISILLDEGVKLVDQLLILCNHPVAKVEPLSLRKTFPQLYRLTPTSLIIPLQTSLNVSLPSDATQKSTHKPFPERLVVFQAFDDVITIMNSLQKPRKITVWGDDGKTYSFLCKPKDDLRKDARLMEFNSMIIKLLKKDSDARKRRLDIRTYSVVPLNEECGLIEWVPNVVVLRGILSKAYSARGILAWSPELRKTFETIRDDPSKTGERFEKEVLVKFPPVFHSWFLETFPEPSEWFRARMAYSRTNAVMSMVGFVLGLGDRHCENILLDATTGDTVHVDFNCLFDRGRTFDVAEKVPFRLTTNIIDGMGVTGVEGFYRRAAEITLRILRDNKDSLMSVLETFLHDPLVEWNPRRRGRENTADNSEETAALVSREARRNLDPISNKLRGLQVTSDPAGRGEKEVTVAEQVERLIREARSPVNLGSMYVGWSVVFLFRVLPSPSSSYLDI